MKINNILIPLFIGSVLFTSSKKETTNKEVNNDELVKLESKKLNNWFQENFEKDVSDSPMRQTYLGQKTDDYGKWDDISDKAAQKELVKTKERLRYLNDSINITLLNDETLLSFQLAKKGFENIEGQCMRCTLNDLKTTLI